MSNTVTEMWTTTMNLRDGSETDNTFRGERVTQRAPVRFLDVTRERANPNLVRGGNFEDEVWATTSTLKTEYFEAIGSSPAPDKITETNEFSRASLRFDQTTTKDANAEGYRSLLGRSTSDDPNSKLGISFKYNLYSRIFGFLFNII